MARGILFDEGAARDVERRLRQDGYAVTLGRERYAGEDDDEDHPWVVSSDAPVVMLELLVEEYDGWLEPDERPAPSAPLVLPTAPRRVRREL